MRRYIDGVGRFFRSKCSDGVEDLMQRTFLACAKRRDSLRDPASFRSFLFAVAAKELAEHYRRQGRQMARLDGDVHSAYDIDPSPSMLVAQRQERRVLLEALRRIPLNAQIAIELHYWERLRTHEIADVLGVPEGTVKSRLRRARELLKTEIDGLEGAGTPLETTLTELGDWARAVKHRRSE
jgi:RNA polymerase sigma-70 factor (ECF subfamily)